MAGENKFTKEEFLKKVQEGDSTLLIVGAVIMIIPLIALLFLTTGKTDKKMTQQKLKSLTQRKNVFNFGTKTDNGKKSAPKSGMPSKSSNWFGGGTPEQRVNDELHSVEKVLEKRAAIIEVPSYLTGDARKQYIAEMNYNLCMGNGALEAGRYDEAEEYIKKAIDEAKDNEFLNLYALGSLCALYERTGDKRKLEEAYKLYIEAVSKIPPEHGGMDLKSSVRDVYQGLAAIGKHASEADLTNALANDPLVQSGQLPPNINIREVYKNFPIKYE